MLIIFKIKMVMAHYLEAIKIIIKINNNNLLTLIVLIYLMSKA